MRLQLSRTRIAVEIDHHIERRVAPPLEPHTQQPATPHRQLRRGNRDAGFRPPVGFFGDDLGAESFAEEVGVGAGVVLQDHVVLADRVGFFLGRQRDFWGDRCGCGSARLLSGHGRFRRPAFAGRLLATVDLRRPT